MKQIRTKGIILTRINYGEADRIITFLTPDQGKVTAIAKAVRKPNSKLAGGIELFSVSDIGYIVGKSEINTLISTRLAKYYANIVKNIERTAIGYDVIKIINKVTEDNPEPGYFRLVEDTLKALDDDNVQPEVTKLWFDMQLLRLSGHSPELKVDTEGHRLEKDGHYLFNVESMKFTPTEQSGFSSAHIQFLRLGFSQNSPRVLQRVEDIRNLTATMRPLLNSMLDSRI
jgi:DNA repair protein RecO (recombination protein O)